MTPFGAEALNLNFGIQNALIYNANRKKNVRAVKAKEMSLGEFIETAKTQSAEQQVAMAEQIASVFGAKRVSKSERKRRRREKAKKRTKQNG